MFFAIQTFELDISVYFNLFTKYSFYYTLKVVFY